MTEQTTVKGNGGALTPWGSRDEVRELVARLRPMLPNSAKLNDGEIKALAQGAVAHGLDPLNGEIWIIPGRGLMIGVKGLRKKAREQVKGNFWIDFREIVNPEERKRLRIPDGALAYEARLFDSENIRTYTEAVSQFTKAGIPWEAVREIMGDKPYTSGIGVLAAGEQTKMQPAQCAMKRAEADALKRRFDVPFGLVIEGDEPEYGGEWVEGEYVSEAMPLTDASTETDRRNAHALWDEPDETPPAPAIPETPESAPAPAPPADNKPTRAKLQIYKHADWQRLCAELVKAHPKYQTTVKGQPNGQPNMFHILGAAAACGFPVVTDENMQSIIEAIAARAAQEKAEEKF